MSRGERELLCANIQGPVQAGLNQLAKPGIQTNFFETKQQLFIDKRILFEK